VLEKDVKRFEAKQQVKKTCGDEKPSSPTKICLTFNNLRGCGDEERIFPAAMKNDDLSLAAMNKYVSFQ